MSSFTSRLAYLFRQRSFQVALALWVAICAGAVALCHGTMPLPIGPHPGEPVAMVIWSSIALLFLVLEAGLIGLIARHRAWVAAMWGRPCSVEGYSGLADLYLAHPDFVARYERIEKGFTAYLTSAMRLHATKQPI